MTKTGKSRKHFLFVIRFCGYYSCAKFTPEQEHVIVVFIGPLPSQLRPYNAMNVEEITARNPPPDYGLTHPPSPPYGRKI